MQAARQDLELKSPWLNAAGSLGFAPPAQWAWEEPQGAFLTNPISWKPRTPAEERGLYEFAGGFLLHTGWPNPGFHSVLHRNARRWAGSDVPIWVSLLGDRLHELNLMIRALEGVEGVSAVVLGLPPEGEQEELMDLVSAGIGELPLVVSVPLDGAGEDWVDHLPPLGVSAVNLSAPRGSLPTESGRLASGRIYGPGLLPLAVEAVRKLKRLNLPVISSCGVYSKEAGRALLGAGALAVGLDAILWQALISPVKSD